MNPTQFSAFLKSISPETFFVLDMKIPLSEYIPIDLSVSNAELNRVDVSSSERLGDYIEAYKRKHNAKVAYGGYLETRNIYQRSSYFNSNADSERDIHLGLDLWLEAGSPIFAPLDATVHSFKNNTNHGDYGPTIILQHDVDGVIFRTLYGHLSAESIKNLKVGQSINQGEKIATLGDASVNGDYPPHLHFQIIQDLQGNYGDYPGVCSKEDLEFYKGNCPDPILILKFTKDT